MNSTTKIVILLILGFFPSSVMGQHLDFYDFSISTVYLPSCGGQSESYYKIDKKIKRTAQRVSWKHCNRTKRKNLPKDEDIENVIIQIDSLSKLKAFTFKIDDHFIDTLKSKHFWKKRYNITDQDIDNFFVKRDTITLKLKDIKKDSINGTVLDGAPFWIDLKIKRPGQDTLKFSTRGNFVDDVMTRNIANWLPIYLAYKKHNFFNSVQYVERYFSDKKLENIVLRFIAWTKDKR